MGLHRQQKNKIDIISHAINLAINNINNNSKSFKINGLIFDSEEDYNKLKNIDNNINNIVQLVKNGIIDINDVFKSMDEIVVEETYPDAYDEVDGLFKNATSLLSYEGTRFITEYKVACKFFDIIDVIEYEEIVDNEERI